MHQPLGARRTRIRLRTGTLDPACVSSGRYQTTIPAANVILGHRQLPAEDDLQRALLQFLGQCAPFWIRPIACTRGGPRLRCQAATRTFTSQTEGSQQHFAPEARRRPSGSHPFWVGRHRGPADVQIPCCRGPQGPGRCRTGCPGSTRHPAHPRRPSHAGLPASNEGTRQMRRVSTCGLRIRTQDGLRTPLQSGLRT